MGWECDVFGRIRHNCTLQFHIFPRPDNDDDRDMGYFQRLFARCFPPRLLNSPLSSCVWAASSSSISSSKFPRFSALGILFHRTLLRRGKTMDMRKKVENGQVESRKLKLSKGKCEISLHHFTLDTYSGIPSGGSTIFKILSINLYLRILSFTVVDVSEGDAFTSTSHAFKLLSIIMS